MAELTFRVQVAEDGSITENYGSRAFRNQLKDFAGEDCKLTIGKWRKKRSLNQNDFYFGIFLQQEADCFKEYWGETYDLKTMHAWNKQNFWGEEKVIEATGEIVRTPATSSDKNTLEWETKMESIRQWFRQSFNYELGYPDQQAKIRFRK